MPKILVIGATGYIGRALCASLLRSGNHTVYGLARTPDKARALAAAEITPVRGSATDSAAYRALIRDAHIDVVVDVAGIRAGGAVEASRQIVRDVRAAGRERAALAKRAGVPLGGARLGYIHTSGVWIHGEAGAARDRNDLDPVGVEGAATPAPRVGWRVDVEREALDAAEDMDVAVVRPGVVYGGGSWVLSAYLEQLSQAAAAAAGQRVALQAAPNALVSTVHVEDAGAALHALVDRLPLLARSGVWPVFDVVSAAEPLGALLVQAGRALGVDEDAIEFAAVDGNTYAQSMSTTVMTNSGRARSLLGWEPRKIGMLSQMGVYVRAWQANRPE